MDLFKTTVVMEASGLSLQNIHRYHSEGFVEPIWRRHHWRAALLDAGTGDRGGVYL